MAEEIKINLKAEFGKLRKDLEDVTTELSEIKQEAAASMKKLEDEAKKTSKGVKGLGKAFSGVGAVLTGGAFKLGSIILEKVLELFRGNQKVVDALDTAMNSLQIVFNDFFGFIQANVGGIVSSFKAIFNNPLQSIKNLGKAIQNNFIERIQSAIDALGFLGSAVKKALSGDWTGAVEDAKSGAKELVDTVTGVDGSFDKIADTAVNAAESISNYSSNTLKAAASLTQLNKQSKLAEAQNALLLQQYDKESELQRQIRDDVSLGIDERIAANKELGLVLDKQEKAMKANAQTQLNAAQAALNLDKENLELQIAVIDKKREIADVEAAVTGFRAEQLTNTNALEKERLDGLRAIKDKADEDKKIKDDQDIQDEKDKDDAHKKELARKAAERAAMYGNLNALIDIAGKESAIGKALFIAKQAMRIKDQIAAAKDTIQKITMKAAEAGVDTSAGFAKTAAAGFPQNIPLLLAFAGQAVGIFAAIRSAVKAAKGSTKGAGGGGGGNSISAPKLAVSASAPPAFNVVGSSDGSQIAQAINGQDKTPTKTYVISSEVSDAQSLDRQITENASIG
tara:strand:- start:135 stop:1838 length:1704 start_codon:yes stop_codon:yes gene_type:complete